MDNYVHAYILPPNYIEVDVWANEEMTQTDPTFDCSITVTFKYIDSDQVEKSGSLIVEGPNYPWNIKIGIGAITNLWDVQITQTTCSSERNFHIIADENPPSTGYGAKFEMSFDDLHTMTPCKWTVQFLVDGYSGEPIQLVGATNNPLVITTGKDTDWRMEPILGSTATVTITVQSDSFDVRQFYLVEKFQMRCVVWKTDEDDNTTLFWSGFVNTEFSQYPLKSAPYPIRIIATDGLSGLKGVDMDLGNLQDNDRDIRIDKLLTDEMLWKAQDNEIKKTIIISSLRESGAFIEQFCYFKKEFFKTEGAENLYQSDYDILIMFMKCFGWRLFFSRGAYHIQRVTDLAWGNTDTMSNMRIYDENFPDDPYVAQSPPFATLGGQLSSNDMIYAHNDSVITIKPALKTITQEIDYKYVSLIKNADWRIYDPQTGFLDWGTQVADASVGDYEVTRVGEGTRTSPYRAFVPYKKPTDSPMYYYPAMFYQNISGDFEGEITIDIDVSMAGNNGAILGVAVYLLTSGTEPSGAFQMYDGVGRWIRYGDTPESDNKWTTFMNGDVSKNYIALGGVYPRERNVKIKLPAIPHNEIPGVTGIRIGLSYGGGTIASEPEGMGVYINSISLNAELFDYSGERDTISQDKEYIQTKELTNFDLMGSQYDLYNNIYSKTGPAEKITSNAFSDTDITLPNDTTWNLVAARLHIHNIFTILGLYYRPYEELRGTYFSNDISFDRVIKRPNGKLYMQMRDVYNVRSCEHQMVLQEIFRFDLSDLENSEVSYEDFVYDIHIEEVDLPFGLKTYVVFESPWPIKQIPK